MNKSLENYLEMRLRVSCISRNSIEIFLKNEVVVEEDGNGMLAYEISGKYLGKKKI